jgi:hypothetical protein
MIAELFGEAIPDGPLNGAQMRQRGRRQASQKQQQILGRLSRNRPASLAGVDNKMVLGEEDVSGFLIEHVVDTEERSRELPTCTREGSSSGFYPDGAEAAVKGVCAGFAADKMVKASACNPD